MATLGTANVQAPGQELPGVAEEMQGGLRHGAGLQGLGGPGRWWGTAGHCRAVVLTCNEAEPGEGLSPGVSGPDLRF